MALGTSAVAGIGLKEEELRRGRLRARDGKERRSRRWGARHRTWTSRRRRRRRRRPPAGEAFFDARLEARGAGAEPGSGLRNAGGIRRRRMARTRSWTTATAERASTGSTEPPIAKSREPADRNESRCRGAERDRPRLPQWALRQRSGPGGNSGLGSVSCLGKRDRWAGTQLSISKRGDTYLRTLLIHGARSAIVHGKLPSAWRFGLAKRRPSNVVAMALANTMRVRSGLCWPMAASVDGSSPAVSGDPRRELSSMSRHPVGARRSGPWCASFGPVLEHVGEMEQAVEERDDGNGFSEELPPVADGMSRGTRVSSAT